MRSCVALFTLLAMACCTPALADGFGDLQQRLQKKYDKIQALSADFKRESQYISGGGTGGGKVRAKGHILWQRPLNLRLSETEPKVQEVVSDGTTLWLVQPQRKRVTIYEVSSNTEALRGLLAALSGLRDLGESFKVVKPTDNEKGAPGIETVALEPLQPRADMGRLVVWFDAETLNLKALRIVSMVGNINQYAFGEMTVNPTIGPEDFTYQPPEGFRVFDQRPVQQRVKQGLKSGGSTEANPE